MCGSGTTTEDMLIVIADECVGGILPPICQKGTFKSRSALQTDNTPPIGLRSPVDRVSVCINRPQGFEPRRQHL